MATPLAARVLEWLEGYDDAESGLLGYPSNVGSPTNPYQQPGVPVVRETATFAVGLLARDAPGDRETAARCLRAVLDHQLDRPESVVHGTFRRSPREPEPGDAPREWIDYDPNWREFIGTGFAIALARHEAKLPAELASALEASLRLAVAGTLARNVSAEYTNIALMSAFLLDWAGARLGEPSWQERGAALASAVRSGYHSTGAFPEHNSPTYYGIDLYGLALWRALAPSETLRRWGEELEADFWRDLVRFYHPGLRNLCGPFSRAYGMDMTSYVGSVGLWIAAAEPEREPPLPALEPGAEHGHDFCEAIWIAELGSRPPDDVRPGLASFDGERRVEQRISEEPRRIATAWLSNDCMVGGEHTSGRYVHWQHHPATVHWRVPGGGVGWIRLVSNAPVDAAASPGRLDVTIHGGLRGLGEAEVEVWLEIETGRDGETLDPAATSWTLPGLRVTLRAEPDPGLPAATSSEGRLRVGWRFPPGAAPAPLRLTLELA